MLRLCGAAKQGILPDTRRVLNSCISTVNGAPSITARNRPLVTIIMILSKPLDTSELRARVRSLLSLKRYTDELDSAEHVILTLGMTIEARGRYTDGHCQRLAQYAAALGTRLGLSADDLQALRRGGYLQDLGKIAVPDAVLLKPGTLNDAEREIIKRHTIVGDGLCGQLNVLRSVRPIVRYHHERLDGSGYPDGLRGDQIPLLAQILSIVDIYDALTTDRPYRRALPPDRAIEELSGEVDCGWRRADLVEKFIRLATTGGLRPDASRALTAQTPPPDRSAAADRSQDE
jgi:putative two-component system response regulator